MAVVSSVVPAVDFAASAEKAKKIAERRSVLQAQEVAISKQLEDTKAFLVKEFGEGYMALFAESIEMIQKWDQEHS